MREVGVVILQRKEDECFCEDIHRRKRNRERSIEKRLRRPTSAGLTMFQLGFTGGERKKAAGTTATGGRTSEDVRQCRWKGMAALGVSKVFVFIGLILVDLAHIARGQDEFTARRYEILGDGAGNESGDRLVERLYLNGEDNNAIAIAHALLRQDPDVMTWLAEKAVRAPPTVDDRVMYNIVHRRPQYIVKRDLRHMGSPSESGSDVVARRRKRSVPRAATQVRKQREKRTAHIFIGKKEQEDAASSDVGFTAGQSSLHRRFAKTLSERFRDSTGGNSYRALGSSAVRAPYNTYIQDNDKRALRFIGKRGPFFLDTRSDDAEKRSLRFIGKRMDVLDELANGATEKRSRQFIGKRENDNKKRARQFIGKREGYALGGNRDKNAKRSSLRFIGKREHVSFGRGDDVGETSRWNDIGSAEKRSRNFIGKRYQLPSAADYRNRRRSQLFIGKRSGAPPRASAQQQHGDDGTTHRQKRASAVDGAGAAGAPTAQRRGA